jgi:ABC-type protease/lipase transport system fused ATPase/permease subunit
MRSVTRLSADVSRAIRIASAFTGLGELAFAAAMAGGVSMAPFVATNTDQMGWSMLAGAVIGLVAVAAVMIAARDRILLRTGLWFGHAYAHQHLRHCAAGGATLDALSSDERALRAIRSTLTDGPARARLDALWLPVLWAALAFIDFAHGIAAVAIAGLILLVLMGLGGRKTDQSAATVLAEAAEGYRPVRDTIERWEVLNRASVGAAYRRGKRQSALRAALVLVLSLVTAAVLAAIAWTLQAGHITYWSAAGVLILQARSALVMAAYARHLSALRDMRASAEALATSRLSVMERGTTERGRFVPHVVSTHHSFDVRHAA